MSSSWLTNMFRMRVDHNYGILPPSVGLSTEEMKRKIGEYSTEQLNQFNYPHADGSEEWTICGTPFHILGYTKDGNVAFYGINYVGAMARQEMLDSIERFRREGDSQLRSISRHLEREMEALGHLEKIVEKQ